ncbi:MAG TPA: preprotein translocase subunit SecG [Candidatus Angelobacter sp.]|nr:preprotein translocase subunit SecG [Candidatus Angelobacter sp.]
MIYGLITVVHVFVCAVLIIVVLLQHGKSAEIAATFGGMGSQTAFGPRGTATVLSKATTACAIIFMLTSIALTIFATRSHPESIMDKVKTPQSAPAKK